MIEIILLLDIWNSIKEVNKKYKWYHNLEITLRCLKGYFVIQCFYWFCIGFVSLLYYMTKLLIENGSYSNTIRIGLAYMGTTFVISLFLYMILIFLEPSRRIKEIKEQYGDDKI